jgi:hypothetical protein
VRTIYLKNRTKNKEKKRNQLSDKKKTTQKTAHFKVKYNIYITSRNKTKTACYVSIIKAMRVPHHLNITLRKYVKKANSLLRYISNSKSIFFIIYISFMQRERTDN